MWVKVPGAGYVGVGRVIGEAQRASEFQIQTPSGLVPALDMLSTGPYLQTDADDGERSEYFVPIRWLDTRTLSQAVQEVGFFGNQNTVCKPVTPKWRQTVDRLKELFPGYDGHPQPSMSGAATPTPIGHGLVPPPPND